MGLQDNNLETLYQAAFAAGRILPNFPLQPLMDHSSPFFRDAIIDAWRDHRFEMLEAAADDGMDIPDDKNEADTTARDYYQLIHANAALVMHQPKKEALLKMVEWRTATLIFPLYARGGEYASVTVPLLTIEDVLVAQRTDLRWELHQRPPKAPIQNQNPDDADKRKIDPSNGLERVQKNYDLYEEQLAANEKSCAAFEDFTGRKLPVRGEAHGKYGADILETLDALAYKRNVNDMIERKPVDIVGMMMDSPITKVKFTNSLN